MILFRISFYLVTFLLTSSVGLNVISASKVVESSQTFSKSEPSYYMKQLQLLKLFNNLQCWRDEDLRDLSNTFNPLENLNLYKNPEIVRDYFEGLKVGKGLGKDEPFVNSQNTTKELKKIRFILFLIDDWNLFYKTAAYSLARVDAWIIFAALSCLVSSKYAHEYFRTPPSYEVFPQLFVPKGVLYSLNGLQEVPSSLSNGVENKLNYYKDNPTLNCFHLAWHLDFPFWWRIELYKLQKDRKGELFLYMHRQLLNRIRAERLSVGGLEEYTPIKLNEEIQVGYVPSTLNINFREFPIRLNNTMLRDLPTETVEMLQKNEDTLMEGISRGYFLTDNGSRVLLGNNSGTDIVGATVEASEESVSANIYGNFHNRLHKIVSRVADPDGSLKILPAQIAFPQTSIKDPAFFRIHSLIDSLYSQQSKNLKPHTETDLKMHGVDLVSVRIMKEAENTPLPIVWPVEPPPPVLETFFEDFTFDITNGRISCSNDKAVATIKRHNHKPFKYYLKVFSHRVGKINATVRIYISPTIGYDGKPYSEEKLYTNMIEMDRFTVSLSNGDNTVIRLSKDSAVTIPDLTTTDQLLRETEEAVAKGKERPATTKGSKHQRQCGYPHHMLVPKGTSEGMQFRMFVILTKGEELLNYPGLPLCGVETGMFPDTQPMGFPFERKVTFGLNLPWFIQKNYKFTDVIIKHSG